MLLNHIAKRLQSFQEPLEGYLSRLQARLTLGHVTAGIRKEGTILAYSEGTTRSSRVTLLAEYKLGIPFS
jgi:hypothetical protein